MVGDVLVQIDRLDKDSLTTKEKDDLGAIKELFKEKVKINNATETLDKNYKIATPNDEISLEQFYSFLNTKPEKFAVQVEEGINPIQRIVEAATNSINHFYVRCGDCVDIALILLTELPTELFDQIDLALLEKTTYQLEVMTFSDFDHVIIVINRGTRDSEVSQWNDDTCILDPYTNKCYLLKEIRQNPEFVTDCLYLSHLAQEKEPIQLEPTYGYDKLTLIPDDRSFTKEGKSLNFLTDKLAAIPSYESQDTLSSNLHSIFQQESNKTKQVDKPKEEFTPTHLPTTTDFNK